MAQSGAEEFFDYFEQVRSMCGEAYAVRQNASRIAERDGYWADGNLPDDVIEAFPRPDLRQFLNPEVRELVDQEELIHKNITALGESATREFVGRPVRIVSIVDGDSPIVRFSPHVGYSDRDRRIFDAKRVHGLLAGIKLTIAPDAVSNYRQVMIVRGRRLLSDLYYRGNVVAPSTGSWSGTPQALRRLVRIDFLDL